MKYVRFVNMTDSKTNTTTNFMDIHVSSSFKLHAVFVDTITRVHRLRMIYALNIYVGVGINQTGNDTLSYDKSFKYKLPVASISFSKVADLNCSVISQAGPTAAIIPLLSTTMEL